RAGALRHLPRAGRAGRGRRLGALLSGAPAGSEEVEVLADPRPVAEAVRGGRGPARAGELRHAHADEPDAARLRRAREAFERDTADRRRIGAGRRAGRLARDVAKVV